MAGAYNIALGSAAADNLVDFANYNVMIGFFSGENTGEAESNVFIGPLSGNQNANGNNNTFVGPSSGVNSTGSDNIAVGNTADISAGDNAIIIATNKTATCSNCVAMAADVNNDHTFVFGDGSFTNWGFGVEATAGAVEVGTNGTNGNGAYLSAGGVWTNTSDINKKEHITPVQPKEILEQIMTLDIPRWNYIGEDASVTHIGPMAQQFYETFKTGNNNKSISTIDPAGVALVGIQQLKKDADAQAEMITSLKATNEQLAAENEAIKAQLAQLIIVMQNNGMKVSNTMPSNTTGVKTNDRPYMQQNRPNPANGETRIDYFIPQQVNKAMINVYTQNGVLVKGYTLSKGAATLVIGNGELTAGTYSYELVVDGRQVESMKWWWSRRMSEWRRQNG